MFVVCFYLYPGEDGVDGGDVGLLAHPERVPYSSQQVSQRNQRDDIMVALDRGCIISLGLLAHPEGVLRDGDVDLRVVDVRVHLKCFPMGRF